MRSTWTDERLDDFREHVDARFDGVDARLDRLEGRFEARFEALQHTTIQLFAAIMVAMVTGFVTLAGLIVTQL